MTICESFLIRLSITSITTCAACCACWSVFRFTTHFRLARIMRSSRALVLPAVGGFLATAFLTSVLVAAEGRRSSETRVIAGESDVEGEEYVVEDCGTEPACHVLEPCRGVPLGMLWWEADYLLWWAKGMEIPPLVTAGSTGALGDADTRILYGDERILDDARSGFRVGLGSWLDCGRCYGLEGDYWMLGEATDHFQAASDAQGNPSLFRPFFNVNPRDEDGEFDPPAREDAEIVASPELLAGSVLVDSWSQLQGAGIRVRRQLCCESSCDVCWDGCGGDRALTANSRLDLLVGYRFVRLREGLAVREDLTFLLPSPDEGDFEIADEFRTGNSFHGADLGVAWRRRCGPWLVDLLGKLAVGGVEQTVTIAGQTVISGSEGDDGTYAGGLLASAPTWGLIDAMRLRWCRNWGSALGISWPRVWRRKLATTSFTGAAWCVPAIRSTWTSILICCRQRTSLRAQRVRVLSSGTGISGRKGSGWDWKEDGNFRSTADGGGVESSNTGHE